MEATGSRLVLYGNPDPIFSLYPFADIHLGNRACLKSLLDEDIARVNRDPYALWWLLGDYGDFISHTDPRFDPEMADETLAVKDLLNTGVVLVGRVLERFLGIKGKCLAAGYGNHELKYFRDKEQAGLHDLLCSQLEVPSFRYSGFFDLYFERQPGLKVPVVIKAPKDAQLCRKGQRRLRVFSHHGAGAAATPGGKINTLHRAVNMTRDADLVVMGHLHEQLAKAVVRLTTDSLCRALREKPTMALMTGSYLRTYCDGMTGYGEVKLYPPSVLGVARATFQPLTGRLSVENAVTGTGTTF